MGKPTGFLDHERELPLDREPLDRLSDWNEFHESFPAKKLREQGAPSRKASPPVAPYRATLPTIMFCSGTKVEPLGG